MAVFTVAKTVAASGGNFSTPQLWEDGAPASLTTAEKSAAGTFLVAAFIQGENLTFVGSGATGKLIDTDSTGAGNGSYVSYGLVSGNPAASDVVTGGTSGATCVLSSGTPTAVGCIWQGQQKNEEFAGTGTQLTIGGSTASTTCYKEYTTFAGASFADNANKLTNALRYNASNGAAIRGTSNTTDTVTSNETDFRISKLQISATGTNAQGLTYGGAARQRASQIIVEGTYTGTGNTAGIFAPNSQSFVATNVIAIQRATGADHIVGVAGKDGSFYGCTFVASDDLATAPVKIFLSTSGGTLTVQNCGLFAGDSTKALVAGTSTFNFTTCYSDISGTAGVTQCTYSSEFQNVNDATRDFRIKAGAAQINTGTTDSTNTPADIVGTSRPQGSAYDVGAWEYQAAAATTSKRVYGD